jgi:hypothetical protein
VKALIFLGAGKNKLEWQEKPDLTVQGDLEAIARPIAKRFTSATRELVGRQGLEPWSLGSRGRRNRSRARRRPHRARDVSDRG